MILQERTDPVSLENVAQRKSNGRAMKIKSKPSSQQPFALGKKASVWVCPNRNG
jgi:hypothetical protein